MSLSDSIQYVLVVSWMCACCDTHNMHTNVLGNTHMCLYKRVWQYTHVFVDTCVYALTTWSHGGGVHAYSLE